MVANPGNGTGHFCFLTIKRWRTYTMSKTIKPEPEKTKVQKAKNQETSVDQTKQNQPVKDDASAKNNGADKNQKATLPEGVTAAPQDPEHIHLSLIQDAPSLN